MATHEEDPAGTHVTVRSNATPTGRLEHLVNIVKAGLATAPFCGGIASLMSDYIPSAKQRRLEEFLETISGDLERLQAQVSEELLLTDEYAYIFEQCLKGAADNYQKERLEAFRGILVHSAMKTDVTDDEKQYFLNLVGTLSVLHIRILKFMAKPEQYCQQEGIDPGAVHGGLSQIFRFVMPAVDTEAVKSAFGDLHQLGLTNTDKSMFGTMTAGQGIPLLQGRVTNFGSKFIAFCQAPREQYSNSRRPGDER